MTVLKMCSPHICLLFVYVSKQNVEISLKQWNSLTTMQSAGSLAEN